MKIFDEEWVQAMQELRRSNATTPIPSKKRYKRQARSDRRREY